MCRKECCREVIDPHSIRGTDVAVVKNIRFWKWPLVEAEQTCNYLGIRSSYAKARRRENRRPTVVIRVFAFVSHQDAAHSAISFHVAIKRLKIEHLLKRKLPRAVLVGFEHRYGNLEPVRKIRCKG